MANRRDFLKTSGAALLVPAVPSRPGPAWVRGLRREIAAIPEDGWDRVGCMAPGFIRQKTVEVTIPGESPPRLFAAVGCVNRAGFAGRPAGTVYLIGADREPDGRGTRLRFGVRRGLRWDQWRHPVTGRVERVAGDGRPLYETFDFEAL